MLILFSFSFWLLKERLDLRAPSWERNVFKKYVGMYIERKTKKRDANGREGNGFLLRNDTKVTHRR